MDVVLMHPERMPAADPHRSRRALVHAPDDSLTINWGSDYSGGVCIEGEVRAVGRLIANELEVAGTAYNERLEGIEQRLGAIEQRLTALERQR